MIELAAASAAPVLGIGESLPLELTRCPLCAADAPDPVGVGEDFVHHSGRDSYLVVRCQNCALLYLNPRPSPAAFGRLYPAGYFGPGARAATGRAGRRTSRGVRRFLRGCRAIVPDGRALVVTVGAAGYLQELAELAGWDVEVRTPHAVVMGEAARFGLRAYGAASAEGTDPGRGYDIVFLLDALQHWDRPVEELEEVARLLKPGGRIAVGTPNADSALARLFAGRHWAGYDFPRHRCLFSPVTLRRLADAAALTVERVTVVQGADGWVESLAHFLRDWQAPRWLQGPAARGALPYRVAAIVAETLASARGRGAVLHAVLRREAS